MKFSEKPIIIGLALFNVAIHLAFYNQLEYHRDELLYFALGKNLGFGYFSVPPLIAWMAAFMEHTLGYSLLAVKLLPALLGGVFVLLVAAITKELGGGAFAKILACVCFVISPIYMRAWLLFQPVPFDIFYWTLILYLILRYINTEKDQNLYWLGIAIGTALMNKYLVVLLLLAILVVLPFSSFRNLFQKKAFYISLGIALIIWAPNLFWQWSKGFPVFHHLSELNETQLELVSRFSFLQDQFFAHFSGFVLSLFGLGFLIFLSKGKKYKVVGFVVIIVFLALMLLRGKSYYTAGIYPVLMAAGAVFIEMKVINRWPRVAVLVAIITVSIPMIPYGLPVTNPTKLAAYFNWMQSKGINWGRSFENGTQHQLPQDYADMIGWEELTRHAASAYNLVENKAACVIYCEGYWEAGAISIIGEQYQLQEPISFSDNFIYHIPERFDPDVESFIYINDNLGPDIEALFEKTIEIGRITNPLAREYGTQVYLCTHPKRSFNEFWSEVLNRN